MNFLVKLISAIGGELFSSVLGWFDSWRKEKELYAAKRSAESNELQKQSLVEGKALEVKIEQAVSGIPTNARTTADLRRAFGEM
jgi:hypothetical protein